MKLTSSKRVLRFVLTMLALLTVLASFSVTIFAEGDAAAAVETAEEAVKTNMFAETLWSLLPPVIAIGLALIT